MPVHDWTRVPPGTFHHFHTAWIAELSKALNGGILPASYYAMAEQVAGEIVPDVTTLEIGAETRQPSADNGGMIAVQEAPPKVSFTSTADETELYALKQRSVVIRHSSGDRVVALIEILSAGNKNRRPALQRFLDKAAGAIAGGHHLLLIDLHPPGQHDPGGIHGALWELFSDESYRVPAEKPLTLAAYSAGAIPRAYVEPTAVGLALPDMPLFLEEDWYVNVPLESTYQSAFVAVPQRWQRAIQ